MNKVYPQLTDNLYDFASSVALILRMKTFSDKEKLDEIDRQKEKMRDGWYDKLEEIIEEKEQEKDEKEEELAEIEREIRNLKEALKER